MPQDPQTIAPLDGDQKIAYTPLDESPPPASDEAPAAPDPAESGEGVSPETEAQADPPQQAETKPPPKTEREKLIAKLTGVEKDTPPKKDEPETPPATEPKDEADPQAGDSKKAPETPPAKAEDDDLTELTNETAKAMKPGEARRKINRLITRIKESEPNATAYKEIVDLCAENNLSAEDYKAWVALGIGLQQQNENARETIRNMADKLGLIPAPAEPPPAAPALTPELETQIQAWEDDAEIPPKVARALRALLGGTPPAKQPAQQPQQPPQQRQPAPVQRPQQPQISPEQLAAAKAQNDGLAAMVQVGERYKTKLGRDRWNEIQPALSAALKAKGAKPPAAWADIYEAEIEKLLSKVPAAATVKPPVKPGTQTAPSKPVFKTERERLLHDFAS